MIGLEAVRRFALGLPGVTEEPHFQLSSFRVAGKIFATIPREGRRLRVFVGEARREPALALNPDGASKLLWGGKVVGLELELARCTAAEVRALVRSAWEEKAPARLKERA